MTVRCNLVLFSIKTYAYGGKEYTFAAQYDQSIPEDQRFAKASPSGEFRIVIDNPAAQAQFELGKSYYFDAHPAPEPAAA